MTLSYQGTAGNTTNATTINAWAVDEINAKASSSGVFAPVALADKHIAVTITATINTPFSDATTPPLLVTFTRTIAPEDYAAGVTFTSPPLSNTKSPGYNLTVTFAVTLM